MIIKQRIIKISLLVCLLVGAGATVGVFYYFKQHTAYSLPAGITITQYSDSVDRADILDIFKIDRYWLMASVDSSPEFVLDMRAPSKHEPEFFGKLKIVVLKDEGQFCGFAAYYQKNFSVGNLLFLAVKRGLRKKGYGKMLLNYVEADMKKMGLTLMHLFTRSNNFNAQSLYRKNGMTLIPLKTDPDHVSFEKDLT